eukprot:NODE_6175_length_916_cov_44.581337_g5584_i0.p1 GENE.NODE_6175_length_916_cov_44.581337_g5584_i0~~NODE_6175_length_916_cov_44.581337_g5584_i0.p1  ORF type:complete len:251 (-),score=18.58 NODE_6175_length_916_cov_44.581337_g5584_i0:90-842(-)
MSLSVSSFASFLILLSCLIDSLKAVQCLKWNTSKVAMIANHYTSIKNSGLSETEWTKNRDLILFQYQTISPNASYYAKGSHSSLENAFYLRFIVDYYECLPDFTIFLHADTILHNPLWLHWIDCLRSNVTFAPLTPFTRKTSNIKTHEGRRKGVEELWDIFGKQYPEDKVINYYISEQWVISRDTLKKYPKSAYMAALVRSNSGEIEARAFEYTFHSLFDGLSLDTYVETRIKELLPYSKSTFSINLLVR